MVEHRPPAPWSVHNGTHTVFLAGSIEMGAAEDWQSRLVAALPEHAVALNPRRADWDASWTQSIADPQFRAQVEWELDALERATSIAMWFAPDTRAPITLLELGLHARSGKLVVGCPPGFWRRGNIEVVCARFAIPLASDWAAFVAAVRERTSCTRAT
jgi:nucleoside 2-deoxyribosyltransferase-like protein